AADVQITAAFEDVMTSGSLSIRRTALAGGSSSRYQATIQANDNVRLEKFIAGSNEILSSSYPLVDGDTLTLRALGAELSLLINGVVVTSVTDSTPLTAAGLA